MKRSSYCSSSLRNQRGSVLVLCMVMAALGTIGVAAWFSLLDARSHQVEASFKALERRVALNNSRALAYQVLYSKNLYTNGSLAADTVYSLPSGKGKATIKAYNQVPLKSATPGSPSRNGATPGTSNTTDVAVSLNDGLTDTPWTFRLRTFNPTLGGDLLSLHTPVAFANPAPLVSGNLRVKGRAVFWDAIVADVSNGIRADEFLLPNSIVGATTFSTTADIATLPLNYPHYLRTTGQSASGPAYKGELELMSATINPQNSYEARTATGTPTKLKGNVPNSKSQGPPTKAPTTNDAAIITMINTSTPQDVANNLSMLNSLSSPVLIAALDKTNPPLKNKHFLQIFDSQISIPNDALTDMMATLDESDLGSVLDTAITDLNIKNGAQYNTNGKGKVQIYLDRPELSQVIVEGVTRLRLFGQPNATKAAAAALLPPLLVVVDNRGGQVLTDIDLFHGNSRPLIVVMISAPATPSLANVAFKGGSAFPAWRVIFDLQNTGLAFNASGVSGCKIIGGIRGNHRITVTGGSVTLERETDGAALMPLLSRDAWIEATRN